MALSRFFHSDFETPRRAVGFFNLETHPHQRTLLDPERMLQEWVTHYPITLRPKLNLGRFRADPERLQHTALAPINAYWGGEPAAEKLTRYLKPAHFTIYTGEPIAKLVAAGRMRAEAGGNVEILERFWNFPQPPRIRMARRMSFRRSWPVPTFWQHMTAAMQRPLG